MNLFLAMVTRNNILHVVLLMFLPFVIIYGIIELFIDFNPTSSLKHTDNVFLFMLSLVDGRYANLFIQFRPFLEHTFFELQITIILSFIVVRGILFLLSVKRVSDLSENETMKFILNSKSLQFLLLFIFFVLFSFGIINFGILIYDGYRDHVYIQSAAFRFTILFTAMFFILEVISELLQFHPGYHSSSETSLYPTQADSTSQITEKLPSDISPNQMVSKAFQNRMPHLLFIYLFVTILLNTPNAFRSLLVPLYLRTDGDPTAFFFILFYLSILYTIFYLEFEILKGSSTESLNTMLVRPTTAKKSGIDYIFSIISTIGLSIIVVSFIISTLFLSVALGIQVNTVRIGPFYNPSYANVAMRNLAVMSGDHILGTDFLGRDILSMLLTGLSQYLVILFLGLIIRFLLITLLVRINSENILFRRFTQSTTIIPKIFILIPLSYLLIVSTPVIFIIFTALFFAPLSYNRILLEPSKFSNERPKLQGNYFRLIVHIVLSILFELIILDFFSLLSPTVYHLNSVVIGQVNNFPTQRPIQTILVMMSPVFLLSPLYMKLKSPA